jgi:hypothetical protein
MPNTEEISAVYQEFVDAVLLQRVAEIHAQEELRRLVEASEEGWRERMAKSEQKWADYFVKLQFWPYADEQSIRPTETILLTYGRTLNPENEKFLEELRGFRNQLLRLSDMQPPIKLEPAWRLGEI